MDGEMLKRMRMMLGMTQADLARRLGTSQQTVFKWESGERNMQHPPMMELALLRLMDERRQLAEEMLTRPLAEDVQPATRPGAKEG